MKNDMLYKSFILFPNKIDTKIKLYLAGTIDKNL